jgi:hypothetical protein
MEDLLAKTCVPHNVTTDLQNMKEEFNEIILPFINEHKTHFRFYHFFMDHIKNALTKYKNGREKNWHEVQLSKTRKRVKRFRVFNYIFKFQKSEFKNCYFMKFMKLKCEFIKKGTKTRNYINIDFLAHVNMYWICFSNIFMSNTTKY